MTFLLALGWRARAALVEAVLVSDTCARVRLGRITGASTMVSRILLSENSGARIFLTGGLLAWTTQT